MDYPVDKALILYQGPGGHGDLCLYNEKDYPIPVHETDEDWPGYVTVLFCESFNIAHAIRTSMSILMPDYIVWIDPIPSYYKTLFTQAVVVVNPKGDPGHTLREIHT